MLKKLTITVDADVYDGLHSVIGRRRISRFLNDLARPTPLAGSVRGYAMASDGARDRGRRGARAGDGRRRRAGTPWIIPTAPRRGLAGRLRSSVGGEIQKTRPPWC
jgi:hypothetical protein